MIIINSFSDNSTPFLPHKSLHNRVRIIYRSRTPFPIFALWLARHLFGARLPQILYSHWSKILSWLHRSQWQRFRISLDDYNHLVWVDLANRANRRLFELFLAGGKCEPESHFILERLAPRIKEMHDYSRGIGFEAQILACMRRFMGIARVFSFEPADTLAARQFGQQLGNGQKLKLHPIVGAATGSVFYEEGDRFLLTQLRAIPVPDLLHLDLSVELQLLPQELNQTMAESRPLIWLTVPSKRLVNSDWSGELHASENWQVKFLTIATWLVGHDYTIYCVQTKRQSAWSRREVSVQLISPAQFQCLMPQKQTGQYLAIAVERKKEILSYLNCN